MASFFIRIKSSMNSLNISEGIEIQFANHKRVIEYYAIILMQF